MFHFEGGLKLTRADLAVDFRRRQPRGFISHAHFDHMARHELALCTPETVALYHQRLGKRPTLALPYRQSVEFGDVRLTTYPAGHCLGSAMLLAEDGGRRLLYTGDFKLVESATAERADPPRADILVLECTFGQPRYRFPSRRETIGRFLELIRGAFRRGATPVIQAYELGKAQEATRILTAAGIGVLQHKKVYDVSRVYSALGAELGKYSLYPGRPLQRHAVIVPPRRCHAGALPRLKRVETFALTGWALDEAGARRRWGVDHAIPLSDHADYDELFECVRRVGAEEVYCTHGPASFADRLCSAGYRAATLGRRPQLRLF